MERSISRRDLLVGGTGSMVMAGVARAATEADEHAGHAAQARHQGMIEAARACVAAGDECIAHCLALFAAEDTSLAACAKAVAVMVPACSTVATLATLDAKRLDEFLSPCINVCADCEQECRKHADKHPVCKACAEACARFITEAKQVKAAAKPA